MSRNRRIVGNPDRTAPAAIGSDMACYRQLTQGTIIGVMRHPLTVLVVVWLIVVSGVHIATAQTTVKAEETPVVKSGEMPLYPPLARQARLEGTVRLEVTTDGVYITKVAPSGAPKLLLDAAEENIRTWRFYKHRPQTFIATFVYKLEKQEVFGFVNPTVFLDLPSRVEIRTKMSTVETTQTQ